jgi:hypothetical protein
MPYLLLAIALLVGGFGLYRFILAANVRQVMALFLAVIILSIAAALFLLAITGRLPAALGLLLALWPIGTGLWMRYKRMARAPAGAAPASGPMTRDEALQILGLTADADEATIRTAHKTLIKKLHPDQDGSAWLAARINQARDVLLK